MKSGEAQPSGSGVGFILDLPARSQARGRLFASFGAGIVRHVGAAWVALALLATTGFAQSYSIDWYKIAGGGGTSTGGVYSVSATIGQHDAGELMTGANYSLSGGFWSLVSVVQTPGLPDLAVSHVNNSVIVAWPNTGSYTLQQNTNVAASAGWTTTGYLISTSNNTNSISITPPVGTLFFRLSKP